MMSSEINKKQSFGLIVLRLFIGWHFLYEGLIKLLTPDWSASYYLENATGFASDFFNALANDALVSLIDFINIFLLIGIGTALLLGIYIRITSIIAIILLLLYYLAYPALPGLSQGLTDGNYWLINKNLIEAAALFVVSQFNTSPQFGIEMFFRKKKVRKKSKLVKNNML